MARWSDVEKGTKAEKPTTFPYAGKDVPTVLRTLSMGEEIEVIATAVKAAEKKGVKDPKPGNAIYDAFLKAHTVLLVCMDPESPEKSRAPFFDGGLDDVLGLGDEIVTMLFEQHEMHQQQTSPSILGTTTKDLFKLAKEVSERGDPFDYARLPLVIRWLLQRFTALLLFNSPAYKSLLTLISENTNFDTEEGQAALLATIREMARKEAEREKATTTGETSEP